MALKSIEKEENKVVEDTPVLWPDYKTLYFKLLSKDSLNNNKIMWIPPKSPHNLIEEDLYHDPWSLLVATIFLNKTKGQVATMCLYWFLVENPTPLAVVEQYPKPLEKYFINLGLQKTRAVQVWRMSYDFIHKQWKSPRELYGIGQYGEDAYKIFCLGDFSFTPKDHFLKIYKAWYEKINLRDTAINSAY
ncbi:unnamed protein product [Acanthoscelides obtectus]|uniref:Methyl-CpG-binding domain protein 4 n=1 Tax=Acanthoscelides obtectus TaxID=200917 RepID=A0A9P0P6F6_ACAOB|nr:unnamed protein product [Acanthoscelides obtectus]CAK1626330.1 Methyl-CpG-binding domain protein 4 [Acanthoscelides obtectus]